MSGTSMDGVDASIIQSDGVTKYKAIFDQYFEYPKSIYIDLVNLRNKIKNQKDLKRFSRPLNSLEKKITLFHAKVVKEILKKSKINIDFIGFHGQTIFHNASKKISKQLGDGKLLSKLTKKSIIYNFRKNDLLNGGQGAPLTPIFHKLLKKKLKIKKKSIFINIGGITNCTHIDEKDIIQKARDVGPGMCMIDQLIRDKTNKKFDENGKIAKLGKINKKILQQLEKNLNKIKIKRLHSINNNTPSLDIKDFNYSLTKKLTLKDGVATLTEFTAKVILGQINFIDNIILCGGGRKNKFLVEKLKDKKKGSIKIKLIDDYGVAGDFVESQAFAYLSIRSFLKLPISFPKTTGVNKPCSGGEVLKFKEQ
jgi:anhydro-N-acetylmuramic acid kinase